MKTESITPEDRATGSERYRADNQGGDGSPGECHEALVRLTMVTGVRDNQQPDDLEAGEGVDLLTRLLSFHFVMQASNMD